VLPTPYIYKDNLMYINGLQKQTKGDHVVAQCPSPVAAQQQPLGSTAVCMHAVHRLYLTGTLRTALAPRGAKGYQGAPRGAKGYQGAPRGAKGYQGAPRGAKGCQGAPRGAKGHQGVPRGTKGHQGVPRGTKGHQGVPRGAKGCQGAPRGAKGHQGVPRGTKGCQGVPSLSNVWQSGTASVPQALRLLCCLLLMLKIPPQV
jgi:hypothetical protein